MNDMIVKSVDLMGDTVMAAQDSEGTIWVGIKWMCQGMGMSDGQYKRQIKNIQKDLLLKSSGSNLTLNKGSGERDVFCLKLDYLPIWLAKISITPTIQKSHPELADKLLEYQLKAKDILAAAFLPNQNGDSAVLRQQIQTIAKGTEELYQRVDVVDTKIDNVREDLETLKNDMPIFIRDAKDIQNALKKKATQALGGYGSTAYKDNSTRGYVFADIQKELRRRFDVKRYDQIKHKDVPDAMRIIAEYKLPLALKNRVDMANAQQRLDV